MGRREMLGIDPSLARIIRRIAEEQDMSIRMASRRIAEKFSNKKKRIIL